MEVVFFKKINKMIKTDFKVLGKDLKANSKVHQVFSKNKTINRPFLTINLLKIKGGSSITTNKVNFPLTRIRAQAIVNHFLKTSRSKILRLLSFKIRTSHRELKKVVFLISSNKEYHLTIQVKKHHSLTTILTNSKVFFKITIRTKANFSMQTIPSKGIVFFSSRKTKTSTIQDINHNNNKFFLKDKTNCF